MSICDFFDGQYWRHCEYPVVTVRVRYCSYCSYWQYVVVRHSRYCEYTRIISGYVRLCYMNSEDFGARYCRYCRYSHYFRRILPASLTRVTKSYLGSGDDPDRQFSGVSNCVYIIANICYFVLAVVSYTALTASILGSISDSVRLYCLNSSISRFDTAGTVGTIGNFGGYCHHWQYCGVMVMRYIILPSSAVLCLTVGTLILRVLAARTTKAYTQYTQYTPNVTHTEMSVHTAVCRLSSVALNRIQ